MRRLIAISCAGVLMATAGAGCYIKKEKIHEPTTIERRSTVETVPRADTEIRTRTTVEHGDY